MTCDDRPRAEVFRVDHGWPHPYQWAFRIHWRGRVIEFGGIPNQCETRRQAAARAGWRCRWLRTGEFGRKYRVPGSEAGK
jgi:hypothetical protein